MRIRSLIGTVLTFSLMSAFVATAQNADTKGYGAKKSGADCPYAKQAAEGKKASRASKTACCSDGAAVASKKAGCGQAGAVAKVGGSATPASTIPAISYKIGDTKTQCSKSAQSLAKTNKSDIQYVVADKLYDNEGEATKAYAEVLDSYLATITTVKYAVGGECGSCPMTAGKLAKKQGKPVRFRLASYDFVTRDAADKAVVSAKAAATNVKMTTRVGEKTYQCSMTAAQVAEKSGKKVEFCVGDKATSCQVTASVELAMAKINAALTALKEADRG